MGAEPTVERSPLDILDVIDSIVDDTHPEGDGCPLCVALDDLRDALAEPPAPDPELTARTFTRWFLMQNRGKQADFIRTAWPRLSDLLGRLPDDPPDPIVPTPPRRHRGGVRGAMTPGTVKAATAIVEACAARKPLLALIQRYGEAVEREYLARLEFADLRYWHEGKQASGQHVDDCVGCAELARMTS